MIRFTKKGVIQYLLIYLMLLCHDAGLYRNNSELIRTIILITCVGILLLGKSINKSFAKYVCTVVGIMYGMSLYHRDAYFVHEMWILIESIGISYVAFTVDAEGFATRFVKTVGFFALISLVFYILANTVPIVVNSLLLSEYDVAWAGAMTLKFKGYLLYVYRAFEPHRNNGIFTEPGVYQIVLTAAMYLLIFANRAIHMANWKKIAVIVIIMITTITTTSTTGYMSLGVILLMGALQGKRIFSNQRKLRSLLVLTVMVLGIEYAINADLSILSRYVFSKLEFSETINNGMFGLQNKSGNARLVVLYEALNAILTKPFGAGMTQFFSLLTTLYGDTAAGARLAIYFAALGFLPMMCILWPHFSKVAKYGETKYALIAYLFIFFNTGMGQSKALYASYLIIPLVLGYIANSSKFVYSGNNVYEE